MINEILLGQPGLDYAGRCLDQGQGPGLCSSILRRLPTHLAAFAPLPEHVTPERAMEFRTGGLDWPGGVRAWFSERLKRHWSEAPGGTLVIQDIWMQRDDVQDDDAATVIGDCVYYLFSAPDLATCDGRHYLGKPTSFIFVGAFVAMKKSSVIKMIHEEDCAALFERLAEVIIGAYDQEGFVVLRTHNYGDVAG